MREVPDRFFSWLGYRCAVVTGIAVFAALMIGLFIFEGDYVVNASDVPVVIPIIMLTFPVSFIVYLPIAFFSLRLLSRSYFDSYLALAAVGAFQGALPVFGFVLITNVQEAEDSVYSLIISIILIALAAISGSAASMVYSAVARKEGILA